MQTAAFKKFETEEEANNYIYDNLNNINVLEKRKRLDNTIT